MHFLLILALVLISEIFDLRGVFISNVFRKKNNCVTFLIFFTILFIFLSLCILHFYEPDYLQIINFLFSFTMISEVCIKISNSEKFINWIGEQLDKSLRILIMFLISLNCTYFFTRITHQIIRSQIF